MTRSPAAPTASTRYPVVRDAATAAPRIRSGHVSERLFSDMAAIGLPALPDSGRGALAREPRRDVLDDWPRSSVRSVALRALEAFDLDQAPGLVGVFGDELGELC